MQYKKIEAVQPQTSAWATNTNQITRVLSSMEPGVATVTDAQSILVLGTVIQNLFVTPNTQQYSQFSVLM